MPFSMEKYFILHSSPAIYLYNDGAVPTSLLRHIAKLFSILVSYQNHPQRGSKIDLLTADFKN